MKWLLVCDPSLPVEDYGEPLPGTPSLEEISGCPASFRALYLVADIDQVRPLASGDERVCRLRPVWEEPSLSPAELLILSRRVERDREAKEGRADAGGPGREGSG